MPMGWWGTSPSGIPQPRAWIGLYAEAPEIAVRLATLHQVTVPKMLERLTIATVAWEDTLDVVDEALQPTLREFYMECLRHNQPVASRGRKVRQ
jgi:hypothetical protein